MITTECFDQFVDDHQLRDFAYTCDDDDKIRQRFLAAPLSEPLLHDLDFILQHLDGPLAVRSSSLLEDSMGQPLAGIYSTLMLPNNARDLEQRLHQAADAIKLVYASTFLSNAKSFLESTGNRIEEEKMAVIVQRLIGRRHGRYFYPCAAGVARDVRARGRTPSWSTSPDNRASLRVAEKLGFRPVRDDCLWVTGQEIP